MNKDSHKFGGCNRNELKEFKRDLRRAVGSLRLQSA